MTATAQFKYQVSATTGYEAEGEATITPEQYGEICKVMRGEKPTSDELEMDSKRLDFMIAWFVNSKRFADIVPDGHIRAYTEKDMRGFIDLAMQK